MLVNPTILMVEDEAHMQDLIQDILIEHRFNVIVAGNGDECLQALSIHSVDLILLDMHLPDIIGIDLFKHIQKTHAHTPCIFVTGENAETEVVLGLEMGAKDYITKPFRAREFIARIKNVLKNSSQETQHAHNASKPEQVVIHGALKLNLNRREAQLNHQIIDFTRTEFDLLKMLMLHPHQVFSRQQILDQVWQDDLEVNERIIDSHIKHIRAKLVGYEAIQTIRGIGYSFKESQ